MDRAEIDGFHIARLQRRSCFYFSLHIHIARDIRIDFSFVYVFAFQ